jgi:hypothetical protein
MPAELRRRVAGEHGATELYDRSHSGDTAAGARTLDVGVGYPLDPPPRAPPRLKRVGAGARVRMRVWSGSSRRRLPLSEPSGCQAIEFAHATASRTTAVRSACTDARRCRHARTRASSSAGGSEPPSVPCRPVPSRSDEGSYPDEQPPDDSPSDDSRQHDRGTNGTQLALCYICASAVGIHRQTAQVGEAGASHVSRPRGADRQG